MNNFFAQILSQLKAAGKKIAIVGVIGLSLWSLATPAHAVPYQEGERGIQSTELYDQIQEKKSGMNNFDAVDPRRDTARVEAKAQTLSDVAARRKAAASDPLEPVRDAVQDIKSNIGSTADNVADGAKDAARDAKQTAENVKDDLAANAKGAARNAKGAARDAKQTAGDIKDDLAANAKDAARDVKGDLR